MRGVAPTPARPSYKTLSEVGAQPPLSETNLRLEWLYSPVDSAMIQSKEAIVMNTANQRPTVTTHVTAEDLFRFSWYHIFHEPEQKWRAWLSYFIAVAGVVWTLAPMISMGLAILAGVAMACGAPF